MSIKLKLILSILIQIFLIGTILLYSRNVIIDSSELIQITYDKPMMSSNFARAVYVDFLRLSKIGHNNIFNKSDADDMYESLTGNLDVVEDRLVSKKSKVFLDELRMQFEKWYAFIKQRDLEKATFEIPKIEETIDYLIESEFSSAYDFVIDGKLGIQKSNKMLTIIGGSSILLILISGFFIFISVTRPIAYCIKLSEKIATGNLDNEIKYNGSSEFIQLLKGFYKMQTDLVFHIETQQQKIIDRNNAEKEKQKKTLLMDLSKRLRNQVDAVVLSLESSGTQLADHAGNLMFVIDDSNSRINSVDQSVSTSVQISKKVSESTEDLVAAIKEISNKFTTTVSVVNESVRSANDTEKITPDLVKATDGIRNLVSIIEKIASQINLLALNATIESARAGEAGMGFAIVANEVKNLAGQTATVTNEITEKVEKVCGVIDEVIKFFISIKSNISKIEQYSDDVFQAITEQNTATNHINKTMHNSLNEIGKIKNNLHDLIESSELVKEASGKVHDISGLIITNTDNLKKVIDVFVNDISKD